MYVLPEKAKSKNIACWSSFTCNLNSTHTQNIFESGIMQILKSVHVIVSK